MKLSRGVLGLPLLMLAFAVSLTKKSERKPISLLQKAQLLERSGNPQESARAYESLVPGTRVRRPPAGRSGSWLPWSIW